VQLKDIWMKNLVGILQNVSRSCTTTPLLNGDLQLWSNWPTWATIIWSRTLFYGSCLVGLPVLPHRITTCSLDWKTIKISQVLLRRGGHCCRGDQVGLTNFWISLWVAFKSQSNGLKSVLNFVGICWINLEFSRGSLCPSWSG